MKNLEYIYLFATKHNFPQSNCEVMFKVIDNGKVHNVYEHDANITSVKFDENLVKNEISIEDIRFDIDSDFSDDVFFLWQEDSPEISFKNWIAQGRYVPTIIKNAELLNEIESLTKDIEMKLDSVFGDGKIDDDSDFEYDDDDDYEDGEE